jgi:hypothetical protein
MGAAPFTSLGLNKPMEVRASGRPRRYYDEDDEPYRSQKQSWWQRNNSMIFQTISLIIVLSGFAWQGVNAMMNFKDAVVAAIKNESAARQRDTNSIIDYLEYKEMIESDDKKKMTPDKKALLRERLKKIRDDSQKPITTGKNEVFAGGIGKEN